MSGFLRETTVWLNTILRSLAADSDDSDDDSDQGEYDSEEDDDLGPPVRKADLARFSSVGATSTASSASGGGTSTNRRVSLTKQVGRMSMISVGFPVVFDKT